MGQLIFCPVTVTVTVLFTTVIREETDKRDGVGYWLCKKGEKKKFV